MIRVNMNEILARYTLHLFLPGDKSRETNKNKVPNQQKPSNQFLAAKAIQPSVIN